MSRFPIALALLLFAAVREPSLAADPPARVTLLSTAYSCPEVDSGLAVLAKELARGGITHSWMPPGWTGEGNVPLFPELTAALEEAGVTPLDVSFDLPPPGGGPDSSEMDPAPTRPGAAAVRFKPAGEVCPASDFDSSARAIAGFLAEHPEARLVMLDGPQRMQGFSLREPLAWLGVPVRTLEVVDGPTSLLVSTRASEAPGLEYFLPPALRGKSCMRQPPRSVPMTESWGCADEPERLGRLLALSEPVLSDAAAGAELAHLRRLFDGSRSERHLCVCRFLGAGGSLFNPARGIAESSGRISIDSETARDDMMSMKTLWHEAQHLYDHAMPGAGAYTVEWEERAWQASCSFLTAARRLGLRGADRVLGDSCGEPFSALAKGWCEVPTAAEFVLTSFQGEDDMRLAAAGCLGLERARGGNPLSLERFRFRWDAKECLRQAQLAEAAPGPESRRRCSVFEGETIKLRAR